MFYDKFIELCKQKGVKPTPLVLELGLSSSNVSQWKKGSTPRPEVLKKIADYFDVSVGYLVGEEQKKPTAVSGELDDATKELQDIWGGADQATREAILAAARMFKSRGG